MIRHALYYARRGWAVLPLHWIENGRCSCGRDCGSEGKHPLLKHGVLEASSAPILAEFWWTKWPHANIGIATGAASGLLVLDVDGPQGGRALAARAVPSTVRVTTGKGWHYYFAHPGKGTLRNLVRFAPGLDLRADGGYVVAPPSRHVSGNRYVWADGAAPGQVAIARAPGWIYGAIFKQRNADRRFARNWRGRRLDLEKIAVIPSGERNVALFRIAGRLCYERRSQSEAESIVLKINSANCRPPLSEREARRVVRSIYGKYFH